MDKMLERFASVGKLTPAESRSLHIFQKYTRGFGPDFTPDQVDPAFFHRFFTVYLPNNLFQAEEAVIDGFYPVLVDFCRFCKRRGEPAPEQAMAGLPISVLANFARVLKAKAALLRFIKSPVLSKDPLVIDLMNYAKKKQAAPKAKPYYEKGWFQVADLFSNQSVVLRKISGYNFYVRLYLNKEVVSALQPEDVLFLTLREKGFLSGWVVEDVGACYLSGATLPEEALV